MADDRDRNAEPVEIGGADVQTLVDNLLEPATMQAIFEESAATLGDTLTSDSLLKTVAKAVAVTEDVWRDIEVDQPAYACRKGCAWCCHQTVMVTAPEVLAAAAYLRETRTPEELDALKSHLAERSGEIAGRSTGERFAAGLACGLLEDGACSIHPARPLMCRGGFSKDAGFCENLHNDYRGVVDAVHAGEREETFLLAPKMIFNSAQVGLATALRERGKRCEGLELTAALRIALDDPDIAKTWLDDESVFDAARLHLRGRDYVTSPETAS